MTTIFHSKLIYKKFVFPGVSVVKHKSFIIHPTHTDFAFNWKKIIIVHDFRFLRMIYIQ